MSRKKSHEEAHENHERWMLTYLDLITLLMIFFIIMYAMSNVSATKYEKLAQSLNSALAGDNQKVEGGEEGSPVQEIAFNDPPGGTPDTMTLTKEQQEASDAAKAAEMAELQEVAKKVEEIMEEKGLSAEVSVSMSERGVVISLKDTVLFESGSTEIKSANISSLIEIGKALKSVKNYVRIEGNTDNVPISNSDFKNNWELSVMRAAQVLRIIVDQGGFPASKICAIGYGEYRPVAANDTAINRAKNRRVDIVILNESFKQSESE
jgi:chemotaxis protein MotB